MGCSPCRTQDSNTITAKPPKPISSNQEKSPESTEPVQIKAFPATFMLKVNLKLSSNYTLGVKIGESINGFVRIGIHKISNIKRAIKTIEKSTIKTEDEKSQFLNELEILHQLDHPNIVRLYEYFEDDATYHLVTEYMPGGELFDYIIHNKSCSESIIAGFLKQILSTLAFIHSKGLVHKNIKPENLLLDRNHPEAIVKLIDFGTSVSMAKQKQRQRSGTSFYAAPEVFRKTGYDEKADIWSCGVVFYVMLCGKPPFYGKSDSEILNKVQNGKYSTSGPEWAGVSVSAIQLIDKMLEKKPKKRISAQDALKDPWLLKNTTIQHPAVETNTLSLQNLRNFRIENKFQHIVTSFITANLLSKEEKINLYLRFKELDLNNDGKLSAEELLSAYLNVFQREDAEEEVKKVMESVDSNKSGFIDYSEFCTACSRKDRLMNEENLLAAFRVFDIDQSGEITVAEVKEILGLFGNDSHIIKLISQVDQNGDGVIDLEEFKQMMLFCFSE